jgi:hypothetical protein
MHTNMHLRRVVGIGVNDRDAALRFLELVQKDGAGGVQIGLCKHSAHSVATVASANPSLRGTQRHGVQGRGRLLRGAACHGVERVGLLGAAHCHARW